MREGTPIPPYLSGRDAFPCELSGAGGFLVKRVQETLDVGYLKDGRPRIIEVAIGLVEGHLQEVVTFVTMPLACIIRR